VGKREQSDSLYGLELFPIVVRRRFSQVFLRDRRIITRLVEALTPPDDDRPILEIGPGTGAVTQALMDAGYRVVAVEVDHQLVEHLSALHGNIRVVHASILDVSLPELMLVPTAIVGSLPYHLSGAILRWLADSADSVTEAVIVLQDEVVRRMAAAPGSRERGMLSVVMQSVYAVRPLFRISPAAFSPRPSVWSRSVSLTRPPDAKPVSCMRPIWKVAGALFQHRRKMIRGSLQRAYGKTAQERADEVGLDLTRRPETLTFAELEALEFAISARR
jgi:16S rRNA (adenine1518-N6/adenine1519-N6)-dimethyltransferase